MRQLLPFLTLLVSAHLAQGVTIDVDTSAAPDLADFGRRVKATLEDWYPRVVDILNSPTFQPIDRIPIYFDPNYDGVAYAGGGRIVGAVNYYRSHQDDVGSMVHEMAHIIQGYRKCDGWVTEGLADWVRYWHYEPNRKPGKPGAGSHYTNGYGVSAYFLDWINSRWDPMNYWINKDCREGTYDVSIFPRLTGKTVDQHWDDMMNSK
ncbi:hypothetical protein Ocin01_11806 [Orchesella cincta]|uniref:Uncharacterized protein n=1 Tax=Orchesella cincta TaxID=48709 RepID=A0A1D2MPS6_ORCCI|nr:hypothetical protein Ocin01_11806 [Orchesella cincta]